MKQALLGSLLFATSACSIGSPPTAQLTEAPFVPDSGSLLLHCDHLIDGISDAATTDQDILIQDGVIVAVGRDLAAAPTVPRLDLPGHSCLPGLIDMHAHVIEPLESGYDLTLYFRLSAADNLEHGRRLARIMLDAGFTTLRNVGVYYGWTSRTLRDEIDAGQTVGPRLHIAGYYLTVPGGGGDLLLPGVNEDDIPAHLRMGVARGAEAFRQRAQAAVDGGADVLKIIASGAVLAYGGVPGAPEMTPAEIQAVVDVAASAGIPVTSHAHGAESIRDSIAAGVDTVEHASLIDAEGIAMAKEHNVALSMDIYNGDWIAVEGRREGWPEEFLRKNDETTDVQRQNFRRAVAAGATMVFGTDAGVYPHGLGARQFSYMVDWGMTPMQAIRAATSVAAGYLKDGDKLGAIRPGMLGDIVAVPGNPLEDISRLEHIDTVIRGGLLFKRPSRGD